MLAWRICRRAHRALDGEGARRYGGRWNSAGRPVIYCSASRALAVLELLVHVDPQDAPTDLYLLELSVPDAAIERFDVKRLPATWARVAEHPACRAAGDAWLAAGKSLALLVPAAPVVEEWNLLINPAHPRFGQVKLKRQRKFSFDPRFTA